jgi:hypothetical protein
VPEHWAPTRPSGTPLRRRPGLEVRGRPRRAPGQCQSPKRHTALASRSPTARDTQSAAQTLTRIRRLTLLSHTTDDLASRGCPWRRLSSLGCAPSPTPSPQHRQANGRSTPILRLSHHERHVVLGLGQFTGLVSSSYPPLLSSELTTRGGVTTPFIFSPRSRSRHHLQFRDSEAGLHFFPSPTSIPYIDPNHLLSSRWPSFSFCPFSPRSRPPSRIYSTPSSMVNTAKDRLAAYMAVND